MTREEAIKILKAIRVYECYPKSASEETKEAIDMAIEALSTESVSRDIYDKRTKADEEIIDSYRQEFQKAIQTEAVMRDATAEERASVQRYIDSI